MIYYEVIERKDGETQVRLRGELREDAPRARLNRDLQDHLRNRGGRTVQVDMSGVELMDLEGVAVLLSLWKSARERGKHLVVRGARGQVRDKLRITGLSRLLEAA